MVQLSVGISGSKAMRDYIHLAQLAEAYGFHTLSIFDDLMFKPAWPILFLIADHTERIRIGPSVANPYLIHPSILAEHAALLDELSGGRAYMGIGRGAFLDFVHVEQPRPISAVREAIDYMRRLWRGDRTPYAGRVWQAGETAHLTWEPLRADIPIMVGTWGPKMCRMAGEVADEVKMGSMWSDSLGQYLWSQIEAGAQAAGRNPDDVGLVFGPLTSISEDRDAAMAYARQMLAFYLPYLAPMPEFVGIEPEVITRLSEATGRGDTAAAVAAVPDLALEHFALYGNANDIIAGIERMVDVTHLSRVEFGMPHGPDGSEAAFHLLGKQVLPHFRGEQG